MGVDGVLVSLLDFKSSVAPTKSGQGGFNSHTLPPFKINGLQCSINVRNKIASITDQLGQTETYSHDQNDSLISVTNRKGQTTTYNYDSLNRITKATYSVGSYTTYAYDVGGRLTTITDSESGTISYTYSDSGCGVGCGGVVDKVLQEVTPSGAISYTYDTIWKKNEYDCSRPANSKLQL